jgi:hypothetical protein
MDQEQIIDSYAQERGIPMSDGTKKAIALAIVAVTGGAILGVDQLAVHWDALMAWVMANWWWIAGAGSLVSLPRGWRGYRTVSSYIDQRRERRESRKQQAADRLLQEAAIERLRAGVPTKFTNTLTGVTIESGLVFAPALPASGQKLLSEGKSSEETPDPVIPRSPAFLEMCHLITTERMPLCYIHDYEQHQDVPAYGTISDLLSMAVTGKPGRGKTTALMYYVCALLKNGAEVFVWDPHGAMSVLAQLNGRELKGLPSTAKVVYLDRKEDIVNSLPVLQKLLVERDEEYRACLRAGRKFLMHPLLLLADEMPVLADYDLELVEQFKAAKKRVSSSARNRDEDDDEGEVLAPSLIKTIRRFVLEARKWFCFFIGSGQSFDAQILPTRVTENLNSRIVFFSSDRRARMSGLENDAIKTLLPVIRRGGSGVMVFDCSRWDTPMIGAIPMIEVKDMLEYLGVIRPASAEGDGTTAFHRIQTAPLREQMAAHAYTTASTSSLPPHFQASGRYEAEADREEAQEADGREEGGKIGVTDLSTIKALREIGKRLKKGDEKTDIVKSFGLPWGRATQEIGAVVDMVEAELKQTGEM